MNKFTERENIAAQLVLQDCTSHASRYANLEDLTAATIALLLRTLELAGGKDFIQPMEENE